MNASPARRRSDSGATPKSELLRVLIVDDDPNYRRYVGALASRCGFGVEEAEDGAAAADRLANRGYDLLVIDQEMPRLTGLELIGGVRDREELHDAYALMLTAREDLDTKLAALRAGFDDFLTKTSSEPEILAKLIAARRIIARQRSLDRTVRELYGLATRDELTGVFNRRFFVAEAEKLLARGVDVCVVLFDLDDFKRINDTFGHITGDAVLRDVGALFHRTTRPEDLVARYGGDEFVMVIVNLPASEATAVARRLAARIAELRWSADGVEFGAGISTGIGSSHLLASPTLTQLLDAADRDLYKNKWLRKHAEPPKPGVTLTR